MEQVTQAQPGRTRVISRAARLRRRRELATAWLFAGPAALILALFMLVPLGRLVGTSFTDWNGISPDFHWIGLSNYFEMVRDSSVFHALAHNLIWLTLAVIPIALGLLLAVVLVRVRGAAAAIYRTSYFLPYTLPIVVVGLAWAQIYDPVNGWLDSLLRAVGLDQLAVAWLGDASTALPALVTAANWTGFGFTMLLFAAGLSAIDPVLYDAARVDGATSFQQFRHVTLPGLANTTNVVVVVVFIATMRVFDIVFVTTGGGPSGATEVLGTMIFRQTFNYSSVGYGAAIAVATSAIIIALAGSYLALREKRSR